LSPIAQEQFLARQGYPSFRSLLAHLVGWWHVGIEVIRHHQADPDYVHPQMDVDAFNNAIIARVQAQYDAEIFADFEVARLKMLDLVASLSDADLANPKINLQLLIEVVEHLEEHQ
jgi:hypothetical protein